jgi:putative CocE/NonD family hydrolase
VGVRHATELVKNLLIPMSDGATLAADLYRPLVERPLPALLSFYPYHKDDYLGCIFQGPLRTLACAGYACLLVDVRGTGNSAGSTLNFAGERERRDYYEVVEWAASQSWCDGNVGAWGVSYGSMAALLAAAEGPPHLRAVAGLHGVLDKWSDFVFVGGRLNLLAFVALWAPGRAGQDFMPPGYRDPDGRWLSVWREHLESNVPWLVTALDLAASGEVQSEPMSVTLERIQVPAYLWAGWRDMATKEMVEAYHSIRGPKKLTVGPWMHELPDVAHAGRVDYLYELRRWFDHWLQGEDTGIMDEPPVSIWVREADAWAHEEGFPHPDLRERVFYMGPSGALSETAPSGREGGTDSLEYDATVGVDTELRLGILNGVGLARDQRADELKGLTYTTPPLAADMEICGVPQAVIQHGSTTADPLLVVKLCDVAPDGTSDLITSGWLDVDRSKRYPSTWGNVSDDDSSVRLNLIPTAHLLRAGHRLRVFVSGSDFPRLLPSRGPGQITITWGTAPLSLVRLPIRATGKKTRKPQFLTLLETAAVPTRAPIYRIEQNPVEGTVSVRFENSQSFGVDGGEALATVSRTDRCRVTASERQPSEPSAHAESEACWESENERIELRTVMAFRPLGLELGVNITLNGVPYWQKVWSRHWPEREWAI